MAYNGVNIAIEEWAGDNGIELSKEQIEELAEAIDTAYEMGMPCGYGVDRYKHEENCQIKKLESKVEMLIRYLDSKGYHCIVFDDRIERTYWVNFSDRSAMHTETFK